MDFKALPKIELHAHLTGSISRRTLHEIWRGKHEAGEIDLEDPLVVMPEGKHDYNLKTFFPLFTTYIYALIRDEASLRKATLSVLEDFKADGVVYLELRTTPRKLQGADGTEVSKEGYANVVIDAIRSFEEQQEAGGSAGGGQAILHTKLILSIDRRDTPSTAADTLQVVRSLLFNPTTKPYIVGLDLCGNPLTRSPSDPDKNDPVSVLGPTFREAKALGLAITLHFAESEPSSSKEETATLLSWEPDRLGHVIWLSEDVKMKVKQLASKRQRGLGLELCLSCNVLGEMISGGFEDHHFGEWWEVEGCHVSLGTDDVGIFGSPLSNEYRLAAEHFNLTNAQICGLARQGIESIFGGPGEMARLRSLMWIFAPQ